MRDIRVQDINLYEPRTLNGYDPRIDFRVGCSWSNSPALSLLTRSVGRETLEFAAESDDHARALAAC